MAASRVLAGALAVVAMVAGCAQACLLPPKGCIASVCNRYASMIIPGEGDYGPNSKLWTGEFDKLAFIRSAFNKNLGKNGPQFHKDGGAKKWADLLTTYPGYGEGKLPSLNYEFYEVNGATQKRMATPVPGVANPNASIAACCNACRLSANCPMYMYLPRSYVANALVTGGTCYFVTTGSTDTDGPFRWVVESDPKSPRTVNIKAPNALTKAQGMVRWNKKTLGVSAANDFPDYALVFMGGYCNPYQYPNGTVTDDPHFTGAHGTRFDFNGELNKAFCLVTDRRIHLNAVLKGYRGEEVAGGKGLRSWIRELGLIWTDAQQQQHTLHLVARSGKEVARGAGFLASAAVDGKAVAVPQTAGASLSAADLVLTFVGTAKKGWYDVDQFRVLIGSQLDLSLSMRVAHPKLRSRDDAEAHFNLMFNDVSVTEQVHGVLGQTYRNTASQLMKAVKYSELNKLLGTPVQADGATGAGFLEGSVQDYEASDVLKPDCKVSTFQA